MNHIAILVTASSADEARRIADALVEERLAACASAVPGIASTYRWQGAVERATEVLLLIKTTGARLADVTRRVRELHGYAVPEVIALPILGGSPDYLEWIEESVT